MGEPIFVVTTMTRDGRKSRAVGFLYDFYEACNLVELNDLDIHEESYKYALIEKVEEGFYHVSEDRIFFEWINEKYKIIKEPEQFKGIVNWGLG